MKKVFRNLIFALCLAYQSLTWIRTKQEWWEWETNVRLKNTLFFLPDFSVSKTFVLTDCYLLNHWWLALIQAIGANIFQWSLNVDNKSKLIIQMLEQSIKIWFSKQPRKPPDKRKDKDLPISLREYSLNLITYFIFILEDTLFWAFSINIDISYWSYIFISILIDFTFEFLQIFLAISLDSMEEEQDSTSLAQEWKSYHSQDISICEMNQHDSLYYIFGKNVTSNVVFSMSAKSKRDALSDTTLLDHDSYVFAIDTCTSESICKHRELFVGKIKACKNLYVQGVGGRIKASGYGTVKLRVIDDDNKPYDLMIHNVIYLPESPINLLSPQRWSSGSDNLTGTGEITVGNATLLFWNDRKTTKLIPHHPDLGIPIMSVNDGYTKHAALFQATSTMTCQLCTNPMSMNTSQTIEDKNGNEHIVPIDDDETSVHRLQPQTLLVDELDQKIQSNNAKVIEFDDELLATSKLQSFEDADTVSQATFDDNSTEASDLYHVDEIDMQEEDETMNVPKTEIESIVSSISEKTSELQRELLGYHYQLKHLNFSALQRLAKKGIIPKRLAGIKPPLCVACQMGKQHRKPWRGKGKKNRKHIRKPEDNFPGANTSTDQMISPYGGMIPQTKGRLMKAKYYAATVFVDHYTDYTYVHLMKDSTAESTLEAKNAYERLLLSFGNKVLAYHADNGRFAEKVFVQDVKDKSQKITYCGVGSHHQNGIAERRIKTLSEDARTMLAHGNHLWPEVVTKSLWPYAYKAASRSRNRFKLDDEGNSPDEKMSGISMRPEIKNEHPLFCPVYVLNKRLQGGIGGIPKWNPRADAGVYLGHSPDHASNVALILSLTTGLVSPQYHVVFDDNFTTVDYIRSKK